jgi:hypothetical protein
VAIKFLSHGGKHLLRKRMILPRTEAHVQGRRQHLGRSRASSVSGAASCWRPSSPNPPFRVASLLLDFRLVRISRRSPPHEPRFVSRRHYPESPSGPQERHPVYTHLARSEREEEKQEEELLNGETSKEGARPRKWGPPQASSPINSSCRFAVKCNSCQTSAQCEIGHLITGRMGYVLSPANLLWIYCI